MALQLKIKESNDIDQTGKLVYLTDNTGNYSSTNSGGYGSPNQSRGQLAIYLIGFLISSKGEKSLLKIRPNNPLTATEWIAEIPQDGYLQFQLVAFPVDGSPDPADYVFDDIVFDTTTSNLVQLREKNDDLIFEVILPAIAYPQSSIRSFAFDQLFIANQTLTKIDLNKRITELYISSESLSNVKDIKYLHEEYKKVRAILQSAVYQFCIGNKYEAAKYIEFLQTNNYKY